MRISQEALTFDDVLLVPAKSDVLPNEARLNTRLTRTISLNIPLISAAMDTVTESGLAIAMAQEGSSRIVHLTFGYSIFKRIFANICINGWQTNIHLK